MKLQEWKKTNNTSSSIITTMRTLVRGLSRANGAGGYRIKSKGTKIKI